MSEFMTMHGLICLLMEMSERSVMTYEIMTANEAAFPVPQDSICHRSVLNY
jgi:hypothetical protein